MQGELESGVHGWAAMSRGQPCTEEGKHDSDQRLGISTRNTEGGEVFFLVLRHECNLAYTRARKMLLTPCALKPWAGTFHAMGLFGFKKGHSFTGHQAWGLV